MSGWPGQLGELVPPHQLEGYITSDVHNILGDTYYMYSAHTCTICIMYIVYKRQS